MASAAIAQVNVNGSSASSVMGDHHHEGIAPDSPVPPVPRPNLQRNSLPSFSVDTPVPQEADITRTRHYCPSISTGSSTVSMMINTEPSPNDIIISNDGEKTDLMHYSKHEKNRSMGGFVDLQCHDNEISRSSDMDRHMSIENEVSY